MAKGKAPKAPKPKAPPKAIGGKRSAKTSKAKLSPGGEPVGSMSSGWSKQARRAPWVAGQSMGIHPGNPEAISRYRHSKKFVARTKKVIRPRVVKYRSPKPPK